MFALLALLLGVGAEVPAPGPAAKPGASEIAPFDLMYLPRTSSSVIAVRPSELLKHIGEQEKLATDLARRGLAAAFAFIDGDLKAAPPPTLADIEQLIVSAQITLSMETEKDGRSSVGTNGVSSGLVRTLKPYDWAGALKKWFPNAETVTHAGRQYVRVPIELGKETLYLALFVADERTLALDLDEDEIKGLLARLQKNLKPAGPAGWNEVCREMVAVCHDTTADGWLIAPDAPKRQIDRTIAAVARKATGVALGFSVGECTSLRVVVTSRDEADALDTRMALKGLMTVLSNEEEVAAPVAKLFARITVNRNGCVVRAHGEVKGNLLRRLLDSDAER
jgi:hypothetical protein